MGHRGTTVLPGRAPFHPVTDHTSLTVDGPGKRHECQRDLVVPLVAGLLIPGPALSGDPAQKCRCPLKKACPPDPTLTSSRLREVIPDLQPTHTTRCHLSTQYVLGSKRTHGCTAGWQKHTWLAVNDWSSFSSPFCRRAAAIKVHSRQRGLNTLFT